MPNDDKPIASTTMDMTVAVIVLVLVFALLGAYVDTVLEWYSAFLEWVYSGSWGTAYRVLAVIIAILDAFLIGFIIFTLRLHAKLRKQKPQQELVIHTVPLDEEVRKEWGEVKRLAASENPSDWNMAIIRADGLLDTSLQRLGYEGETMADRLKIIDPLKLPSMERIWSAHRLRNNIVHGPLQEHAKETIAHALRSYQRAFEELGIFQPEVK